ncbi:MAG: chorismate--pyruvate lyase family protein [Acidimicrobiales bacterium]
MPESTTASQVEGALLRSGGSVTSFLEELAHEPIDADVLAHRPAVPGNPSELDVVPGTQLVLRAVLLTGRRTGRCFVYAETILVVDRLSASVRSRLERTGEPIGRVLGDHGLRFDRQPIEGPPVPGRMGLVVPDVVDGSVLSRRYRIAIDGVAAILVAEWFLPEVVEALST